MTTLKNIGITLLSILCVICIGLDIWYGVILTTGKDKVISQTFILGNQTVSRIDPDTGNNITESKEFCEVNIFEDVYEIKFNFLLDEKMEYFYSQGFQFLANENGKIDFENKTFNTIVKSEKIDSSNRFNFNDDTLKFVKKVTYNRLLKDVNYQNLTIKKYAQDGVTKTSYLAINPITENFLFKIEIGGKVYGMKLKNEDITFDQNSNLFLGTERDTPYDNFIYKRAEHYNDYRTADIYFLAEQIYNAIVCSDKKLGEAGSIYFQFPNIFNYYEFNGKQYSEISVDLDNAKKITEDISSYYGIKFHLHEGKMRSASQSLFKMKDGNSNFALDGATQTDYFTGATLLNVTANDFDWIATENSGEYLFKLSDDFRKLYEKEERLQFYIQIDLDYLEECGVKFVGFSENSLKNFNIYKAVTKTKGIVTEVGYA